jgi:O-antigen/teichoic acid export membrane protein
MAFNRVAIPVSNIMFPILSKVQTSNERLATGYIKTAKYIAIILFPALLGLAAVANPAVAVLWGQKWLPVVVPLQILCLRSAIQSVVRPVLPVFLCKNRPDIPFKFSLCTLVFTCAAVTGLGWYFGLVGVALGMLVSIAPYFVLLWLAFHITEAPLKRLFLALVPPAASATVSSLLAMVAVHWTMLWSGSNVLALLLGILSGTISYVAVMRFRYGDTTREAIHTIGIILGRRHDKKTR